MDQVGSVGLIIYALVRGDRPGNSSGRPVNNAHDPYTSKTSNCKRDESRNVYSAINLPADADTTSATFLNFSSLFFLVRPPPSPQSLSRKNNYKRDVTRVLKAINGVDLLSPSKSRAHSDASARTLSYSINTFIINALTRGRKNGCFAAGPLRPLHGERVSPRNTR